MAKYQKSKLKLKNIVRYYKKIDSNNTIQNFHPNKTPQRTSFKLKLMKSHLPLSTANQIHLLCLMSLSIIIKLLLVFLNSVSHFWTCEWTIKLNILSENNKHIIYTQFLQCKKNACLLFIQQDNFSLNNPINY